MGLLRGGPVCQVVTDFVQKIKEPGPSSLGKSPARIRVGARRKAHSREEIFRP
jgi:hypothetical protein